MEIMVDLRDFNGDRAVDVNTEPEMGWVITDDLDARGNPIYLNTERFYLDTVPGGPAWPPARITLAIEMFNDFLPGDWIVRRLKENTNLQHLDLELVREPYA